MQSQIYRQAYKDLIDTFSFYKLWLFLAKSDIRVRYRGSTLGPLWITITMTIFIAALSIVYSRIFKQPLAQYIPFLTSGILIWNYVSSVITDSADTFIGCKEFIEGLKLPYFIYLFRMIWRNILIFLHNFLVYILVIIFFKITINGYTLFAIPGFILVTTNLMAISVIISLLGTRFRDLPPIISALITVAFFVSPVTWQAKLIGADSLIIKLNPISYFLDLIRSPLLGQPPQLASVFYCLIFTFVMSWIAFLAFSHHSRKIPFWL
jgi:lipopolysaccharide transport system permease protein